VGGYSVGGYSGRRRLGETLAGLGCLFCYIMKFTVLGRHSCRLGRWTTVRTVVWAGICGVWLAAALSARAEEAAGPRPVGAVEVIAPKGEYALVTLDFEVAGASEAFARWRYMGGMRDGRMRMDHGIGIREPGGWLEFKDGRLRGTFTHGRGRGRAVEFATITVDAVARDGVIDGRATIGQHEGKVTGRVVSESELARQNPIPQDKGWPSFLGPVGGGCAAQPSGVPTIGSADQIRLVWRTEETDIGQGIGSISRFMHNWADANGRRAGSGSASPVLADGRVYLSYYVPSPARREYPRHWLPTGYIPLPAALERLSEQSRLAADQLPSHALEKVWESADDVVLCVDAATGRTLWKAVMRERGINLQHHKQGPFNMTAGVGGGRVFAIGMSNHLYAFDAASGKPLWEMPLGLSTRSLYSATVLVTRNVVVAPWRNRWAGLDPASGTLKWESAVPMQHVTLSLWSAGDSELLIGGVGEEIVGLDAATGREAWRLPGRVQSGGRGLGSGGMVVHGDRLLAYVHADAAKPDQVFAVAWKLDGNQPRQLWQVPVDTFHGGTVPVVVRGRYVFTGDLQVIDIASGKVVARGEGTRPGNGGYLQAMEDLVMVRRDGTHGAIETCFYKVAADGAVTNLTPERDWRPPFGGATTSYHHPIMYPMVAGRMFLRQYDGIYCWDLRAAAGP
jgi:outer membrane protein assembly factor BamB